MAGGSKKDTTGSKKKSTKRTLNLDETFETQYGQPGATSQLLHNMINPTGAFGRTSGSDEAQWNPHLLAPASEAQNPPASSSYPALFPHLSQQLPATTPYGGLYPQHPPVPNFGYNPQQNINVSQPGVPQFTISPEVISMLARMTPTEQAAYFRAMTHPPPQQPPQPIHIQQSQVYVTQPQPQPLPKPRRSVSRVPSGQSSHSLDHSAGGSARQSHGSQRAASSHRQSAEGSRRETPTTQASTQPTQPIPPPPPTAPLYGPMTGPPPGVDEPCGGRCLGSIPGRNSFPPVINQGDYPEVPVRPLSARAPNPTPQINRLRDRPLLTVAPGKYEFEQAKANADIGALLKRHFVGEPTFDSLSMYTLNNVWFDLMVS